jgi:beta-fructofuranosidase
LLQTSDVRDRPRFHITAPHGWLNDPNGVVYAGGRYHVFFQHNPDEPRHGAIVWGHTSSADLIDWTPEPIALRPRPGQPDEFGCWTGVVVEDAGRHVAVYSGVTTNDGTSSVLLADADETLTRWTPRERPATGMPDDPAVIAMRDPYVFSHAGRRYAVVGAGLTGDRPAVLLYDCERLDDWRYLGVLLDGTDPAAASLAPGHIWECPQLVRLDGRWVLIVSLWQRDDRAHELRGVSYLVGDLEPAGDGLRFAVAAGGEVDAGPDFYAPQAVPIGDRTLLWGWSWERRDQAEVDAAGWAGALTWPRELTLSGDRLTSRPAAELTSLYADPVPGSSDPGGTLPVRSEAWVATIRPAPGASFRLELDDPHGTPVLAVEVTVTAAGVTAAWSDGPPAEPGPGGTGRAQDAVPEITVVVDGSVVEAYCDGLPPYTRRAYRAGAEDAWTLRWSATADVSVRELVRPNRG